ncbi:MAG: serine/threonine-protein kinase HipA [Gammaproteobacteria bacterium]|jgi:serine/threonine-protein kinase HipA
MKQVTRPQETVSVLQLRLHNTVVAYLAGYAGGRNILTFAPAFISDPERPTFTLTTHPDFPHSDALLSTAWIKQQRLHPVLSNLLPEGALREWLAQTLKIHQDNEFPLFVHLGQDLPGAIVAEPVAPADVPAYAFEGRDSVTAVPVAGDESSTRFSLAGVQMKFSMRQEDGRYHMTGAGELGNWIIKTPSTRHPFVPRNEFSAMTLAELAGVEIPPVKLVELQNLNNLPAINLPQERHAFAIQRFDRVGQERIHMEDFAQVFVEYADQKYGKVNYEQMAKVLYQYSGKALQNAQQFARRLLVNILLANGEAHIKNWSLIYADGVTPELSPAYDILSTRVYMGDEKHFALNLGKTKAWYEVDFDRFQAWARAADIPWRAIKPHLDDTLDKARTLWPQALRELPMVDPHKRELRNHWSSLQAAFRIDTV